MANIFNLSQRPTVQYSSAVQAHFLALVRQDLGSGATGGSDIPVRDISLFGRDRRVGMAEIVAVMRYVRSWLCIMAKQSPADSI